MIRHTRNHFLIGLAVGAWLFAAAGLAQEAPPPTGQPTERPPASGWSADKVGEATFQYDPETGSIIVIADEETNLHIEEVIKQLDKPVPQVLIKVLFLEVTHGNALDLGVEARFQHGQRTVATDAETAITDSETVTDGVVSTEHTESTQYTETQVFKDALESIFGLGALYAGGVDGGYYRIIREDLDATIRALAQVGKLEVLSRPSILARNNQPAIITLGKEVPFITNTRYTDAGNQINTIEYEDVGIILEVTPHITPDGLVEMTVAPEISTLTGETVRISDTAYAPVIAKRAAETTVVVPDGMTVVIGGLMEDSETEDVRKLPILGDIPWLGTFFRRTVKSKTKTELIIFLTPHVVMRTRNLETMSIAEAGKAQLVPKAFTRSELQQHLDAYEKLVPPPPPPGPKPGVLKRTGNWLWSEVEILK